MDLDSVAKVRYAFYRLVGSDENDTSLTEQGESTNDVAYVFLTRGTRAAQRWLLKQGYQGWRKRSSALSWSGADATDGGRYSAVPSDFLRAYGNQKKSALVEANGERWGQEIHPENDHWEGDFYYFRGLAAGGDGVWLTRRANPPTTVYLDYHYAHPVWSASVTIDFPLQIRALAVTEAAACAKDDNWLPGGLDLEAKIERALQRARTEAMDFARPTKQPRELRKPARFGNRW